LSGGDAYPLGWRKALSVQQPLSIKAPPYPLSSRAKPRDLRFYEPVVEKLLAAG
jgi:hypothetical protein